MESTRLSDEGIGHLRIGARSDAILRECDVVADRIEADAEAMPQRILVVRLADDSVRALLDDAGSIWRIEFPTARFVTEDSIGVGTSLQHLMNKGKATGLEGDGRLFVILERHCGLSFRLDYLPAPEEHRTTWFQGDLERIAAGSRIDLVVSVGCPEHEKSPFDKN